MPRAIFDGHNDTIQRTREYLAGGADFLARSSDGHLDLPRAIDGGMVGGLFAMFVRDNSAASNDPIETASGYEFRMARALDPEYARVEIAKQLAAFEALAHRAAGILSIATSTDTIQAARNGGPFAIVMHMEGAEAIDPELEELGVLYDAGLRSLGLVWSRPNLFGHGVPFAWPRSPDTGPGLTEAGKRLVRACNRRGIMIDLSHLNEQGFWDVEKLSESPLVASHSCAHAISATARNLTDRQLDAIRASDGIVGVNLCVSDVRPDGDHNPDTALGFVADQFRYLVDRLGIDRVALGSDFDGAPIPTAIGDAAGLPRLFAALEERGFDEAALEKLAFSNWMRVLRLCWKEPLPTGA